MKVLILGVNGFIGNALTRAILEDTDWHVFGLDIDSDKLDHSLGHQRFHYVEGDVGISNEWIEYHVKKCDVVLPLVAIATPAKYIAQSLSVFDLVFEQNLKIVRWCVAYRKRLLFPSTSEVYGMCEDDVFDEETSPLVLGPIAKSRWIYSASKQLLDRVIFAYGQEAGLRYTLFRPFNWIGPRLDSMESARLGNSRLITQFIANLLLGEPLVLVNGGEQRRCFTYLDDGIEALMRILHDDGGATDGQIFNIGNPANDWSVRRVAERLLTLYAAHPSRPADRPLSEMVVRSADDYYGPGYQDVSSRVPSVERARAALGWAPSVGMDDALQRTLDACLDAWVHHAPDALVPPPETDGGAEVSAT